MLKIKKDVDLKELKKFGFIYGKEYMHKEHLVTPWNDYREHLYSVYIDTTTKIIEVCNEETEDGIPDEEIANWLVQDLWNANLVEEVEV